MNTTIARPDIANTDLLNEVFYALDALGSLGSVANDCSYIFISAGGGFLTVGLSPKPGQDAIAVQFPSTAYGISGCIPATFRKLFRKIYHQVLLNESIPCGRFNKLPSLRIQSVNYAPFFDYEIRLLPLPWTIANHHIHHINSPTLQDLNTMRNGTITITNNYHDDLKLAREYDLDLPTTKMPKKVDLYDAIAAYNAGIEAENAVESELLDREIEADRARLKVLDDGVEAARAKLAQGWKIESSGPIALSSLIPSTVTKAKPVQPPAAVVPPLTEPVTTSIDADTEPATTGDPYRD
jgi:hypothetical protein